MTAVGVRRAKAAFFTCGRRRCRHDGNPSGKILWIAIPAPNQVDMERGPTWRAGLRPDSPWKALRASIIANLAEPFGEFRVRLGHRLIKSKPYSQ